MTSHFLVLDGSRYRLADETAAIALMNEITAAVRGGGAFVRVAPVGRPVMDVLVSAHSAIRVETVPPPTDDEQWEDEVGWRPTIGETFGDGYEW